MKIVHVYAQNIDMFVDAVKGTDCRLNASQDIDYLMNSLENYNGRDVMGLIVFANPVTKKCLQLVKKFDELFVFKPMPIIIISDNVSELCNQGYFHVKSSKVFLVDSEDNSLSDIELASIFTTLIIFAGNLYDLSSCPAENKSKEISKGKDENSIQMSEQLQELLRLVEGSAVDEDSRKQPRFF